MSGREYAREEILEILERERVHYDHSGGGVTFSGGEPLMFPEYLVELLEECGRHKIHRTVDTCGFAPAKTILEVAKHTDLFLYDLKQMNDNIHRKFTGVSNKPIIRNLQLLSETGAEINIRIPLIKNINSDPGSITAFAQFILKLQGKKPVVNLLPYHRIASGKYLKLGKIFDEGEMTEPSIDEQQKAVQIFRDLGLDVEIGG
jgi:pyruvate formate lyase activating enzyme